MGYEVSQKMIGNNMVRENIFGWKLVVLTIIKLLNWWKHFETKYMQNKTSVYKRNNYHKYS